MSGVVSLEPQRGLTVPHIMRREHWLQLKRDLMVDKDSAVSMKLGYADWRHLRAIVVDARLMLDFKQYVVVHLQVQQFDDGK